MTSEISYAITLKMQLDHGSIKTARLLKGRTDLSEQYLSQLNEALSVFAKSNDSTSEGDVQCTVALGDIGENLIASHLRSISRCNTDFCLSDTSSLKDHGDMAVEYMGSKICIEVKNYSKAIPGKEIDKYHRSLALPDYHVGILFSVNDHGFAREYKLASPIDIQIVNGKPSAYISGVEPTIIYPTIKVLLSMLSGDMSEDTHKQLELKTKALRDIIEKVRDMKAAIEAQKKNISRMEAIVNDIHALSNL